jgi:hypothetical protein
LLKLPFCFSNDLPDLMLDLANLLTATYRITSAACVSWILVGGTGDPISSPSATVTDGHC